MTTAKTNSWCKLEIALALLLMAIARLPVCALAGEPATPGRIVILMVWDGLRPDLVTKELTPNLYALEQAGVTFAHHHAVYPTLTMVNAAAIATGTLPAASGILGDSMYLVPSLSGTLLAGGKSLEPTRLKEPMNLESSLKLAGLSRLGSLVEVAGLAQAVLKSQGYVAIIGKAGPTYLFDDRAGPNARGSVAISEKRSYLFLSDDMEWPAVTGAEPNIMSGPAVAVARDAYFRDLVVKRALPAAKRFSDRGHPAMVVFWQHNPDASQHLYGLGTAGALSALRACDNNLARLRASLDALGIANRTDLVVLSDHGFATVEARVPLDELLVARELKKSDASSDVLIVQNDATDLLYLSPVDFPTRKSREAELDRIVTFALSQPWCGPIFSRPPAASGAGALGSWNSFRGRIAGTFNEAAVGVFNPQRAADLVISFREFPDLDNRDLSGPSKPAFVVEPGKRRSVRNRSQPAVVPVAGVTYADLPSWFTTGMGTHGGFGARQLHNFCAAIGPDFRRGFVDLAPTGNADVAPTLAHILELKLAAAGRAGSAGATGRVINETLAGASGPAPQARELSWSTHLQAGNTLVTTTLHVVQLGAYDYFNGATIRHREALPVLRRRHE